MSTSGDSADAEDIFDAIAAAKAPSIFDDLTEEDRIADERFAVGQFEAAASNHTWQDTRGEPIPHKKELRTATSSNELIHLQGVLSALLS